jgi:hypothetical protein
MIYTEHKYTNFLSPFAIRLSIFFAATRKPGPDVHMLNRTIYTIGIGDDKLTRSAVNDPKDVLTRKLGFTPTKLIADPDTRVFYFADPDKTSIYRMPLAFDTRNSEFFIQLYNRKNALPLYPGSDFFSSIIWLVDFRTKN